MPFDGTHLTPQLRRAMLIEALRATSLPLEWDYHRVYDETTTEDGHKCGTSGCALGVAICLWPQDREILEEGDDDELGEYFGITEQQIDKIFFDVAKHPSKTAADVANELELVSVKRLKVYAMRMKCLECGKWHEWSFQPRYWIGRYKTMRRRGWGVIMSALDAIIWH